MPAETPLTAVRRPEVTFARSVRQLRLARGWTMRELAEKSGISAGHVCGIENQSKGCSLTVACRIAEALGVGLDAMIRGEAR